MTKAKEIKKKTLAEANAAKLPKAKTRKPRPIIATLGDALAFINQEGLELQAHARDKASGGGYRLIFAGRGPAITIDPEPSPEAFAVAVVQLAQHCSDVQHTPKP